MSSITFTSVKWKNFLSTGNAWTEVRLDKDKTTLIVGSNGSGKSTILDAISFALYNKPFRNINKPQLVNSINNRDCEVEVQFRVNNTEYRVCRGIKPNFFEVYRNDQLIEQAAAARDYQDILENQILKMNYPSFCQIVVLGSSTYVPFMQLPTWQRRQVIEDLLDIQIFSVMNTLLKKRESSMKEISDQTKYLIDLTKEKIAMQKKHLEALRQNKEDQIDQNNKKIRGLMDEVVQLNKLVADLSVAISELTHGIADMPAVAKTLDKYKKARERGNYKVSEVKKQLQFYEANSNCPTCKQEIQDEFKHSCIQQSNTELAQLESSLGLLLTEYDKTVARLNELKDMEKSLNALTTERSTYSAKIDTTMGYIKMVENENKRIESETGAVDEEEEKLSALYNELANHEAERERLTKQGSVIGAASLMLKDSGIKTRIIKQYIPIINKLINKYLASMEFFVQFELDEQFNEKLKSRFRDEFSYASFSEGEKMRINLAILFTWRAISKMRNSASTNLLIMDEVFDGSLDAAGTEEFLKILKNLTLDTNTFIISHKTDQLFDKFDAVLKFEKHGNFSRMVA